MPITHSFHTHFLSSLEASGSVGGAHRLAAAAPAGRRRRRRRARRRALLSEVAFARRIRVRPRLGRGLRARRRRLLPQAAGRGAVHAGDRAAACWCGPAPRADAVRGGAGRRAWSSSADRSDASSVHVTFLTEAGMARCSASAASCSAPTSSSTGRTTATPASTISSARCRRASARPSGASGATRWRPASRCDWLTGTRPHRERLGRVLRLLHGDRLAQMGPALSDARVLLADRRDDGRPHPAGDGQARRPLHRRRASISSARDTLYGRHWGAIEHHPFLHFEICYYQAIDFAIAHKLDARRGRRAGRAQARARLPAGDHLFGALHRRPGAAAGDRRLSRARARLCGGRRRRACGGGAIPQGFGRAGAGLARREERHAELRSEQHLRQNPARRIALLQGLRGRQGARLPRHHAARARPHAGAAEGAGAQHARRLARRSRRTSLTVAQKIAKAAMKVFGADGITIQQFNEGAGGQVVFHLHVHVIPRKAGVPMKPPASEKEKPDVLSDQALRSSPRR